MNFTAEPQRLIFLLSGERPESKKVKKDLLLQLIYNTDNTFPHKSYVEVEE